jgi:outer membrane murein-binding lipoprotein Lpp
MKTNKLFVAVVLASVMLSGCAVNVITVNHANLLMDDHGVGVSVAESNVANKK